MNPTIALIGRPNVGKSTLFNALTRSRDALVADFPGVTRDRRYGMAQWQGVTWCVVDTGGLFGSEVLASVVHQQALQAVDEADVIFFVVDIKDGVTPVDLSIVEDLRSRTQRVVVVVNKADNPKLENEAVLFHQFGFQSLCSISASHQLGLSELMTCAAAHIDLAAYQAYEQQRQIEQQGTCIAVVGRPNVGKSTLINRLLGEERMVTMDLPGTTRDSIFSHYETRDGRRYTLVDTAGVRRRARVREAIEKFSIIKTLQAIQLAQVCLLLIDGSDDLVEQDLHCMSMVVKAGKGLIIVVNKWDGLTDDQKTHVQRQLDRRLAFVAYAPKLFISAKHGSGVGVIMDRVDKVFQSYVLTPGTAQLTQLLIDAVQRHPPPMVAGRRIKLRYAHSGGHSPPTIVIHGNQTEKVSESYRRYLVNYFRQALNVIGTPIRLNFKTSDNPYQDRKNQLSPGQARKRRRMLRHVKKR